MTPAGSLENPILNSPYEPPAEHFVLGPNGPTGEVKVGRRPSESYIPVPVGRAMSTAWPDTGADILFGIGGTPEGVIAAAALKCMGGELQGRLWPLTDEQRQAALEAGDDLEAVLMTDDLVKGNNCFFAATGITDGEMLKGVHYTHKYATTESLVMRSKSGTVRHISAQHQLSKLGEFSSIEF